MSKYWDDAGRYQKEFEAMSAELMPISGSANTLGGELIRAANKLYYDAFNNGFCNNTSGAIEYIKKYLCSEYDHSKELADAVYLIEPKTNTGGYSDVCEATSNALDTLIDYVAHFVMTQKEKAMGSNPIDMLKMNNKDCYEYEGCY